MTTSVFWKARRERAASSLATQRSVPRRTTTSSKQYDLLSTDPASAAASPWSRPKSASSHPGDAVTSAEGISSRRRMTHDAMVSVEGGTGVE
jgi:hypothetical protein